MLSIRKNGITLAVVLLTVAFIAFVFAWENGIDLEDEQLLADHSRVIAPALWNLDPHSPEEYLKFAAKSNHYERITVYTEPDGDTFIDMWGPAPGDIDKILISVGLIYRKEHTTPIRYQGTLAGSMKVIHFHRTIYAYLYWFLVSSLILFGVIYFLQTLRANHLLEARVNERTMELSRSKERLSAIITSSSDAMIVLDCDGIITLLNPAAETLFSLRSATAVGEHAEALLPDIFQEPENDETNSVLKTKTPMVSGKPCELAMTDSDGSIRAIEVSLARGGMGSETFIVCVIRDISSRKEMEEMLRQSKRMDAIGQLAGGIAHDFNNMLGGIMGAAEVLEPHLPKDEKARSFHKMIIDAADRASELTQQLLSFARKRPLISEVLDVHQLVETAVSLLQSTIDKRVDIRTHYYNDAVCVKGDISQLQSAFLNLGINAWHAMPNGGSLDIFITVVNLDDVFCSQNAFDIEPGEYIDIEFRDTGKGISQDDLPRIFEPFFTTKEQGQGTGLGLSAVFGTVKQHHGTILVNSELGKGTSFNIMLPRVEGKAIENQQGDEAEHGEGTILVVDDEDTVRKTAAAMLERLGYTVIVASDGEEGVERYRENVETISMVVLDMVMPKMNGRDCYRAIREINPDAKVVLISGFTREDYLAELESTGLSEFLRKPFSIKALSHAISKTLNPPSDTAD